MASTFLVAAFDLSVKDVSFKLSELNLLTGRNLSKKSLLQLMSL